MYFLSPIALREHSTCPLQKLISDVRLLTPSLYPFTPSFLLREMKKAKTTVFSLTFNHISFFLKPKKNKKKIDRDVEFTRG